MERGDTDYAFQAAGAFLTLHWYSGVRIVQRQNSICLTFLTHRLILGISKERTKERRGRHEKILCTNERIQAGEGACHLPPLVSMPTEYDWCFAEGGHPLW